MQAPRKVATALLRATGLSQGNIFSTVGFRMQATAVEGAFHYRSCISSSLSQLSLVLGVTNLRCGGWSAAATMTQRREKLQLQSAVPRSSSLSQLSLDLGVTNLRCGGWSAAATMTQRREKLQLQSAVPRRFASTASNAGREGKKRRFSVCFLFLPCVATCGLGTWQLFRRQWKMDGLDYRRKRLEEEPIRLGNAISSSVEVSKPHDKIDSSRQTAMEELEFRTVICEGVYDVTKNLYVGPRARTSVGVTQKGFFVITPLLSSEDSTRQHCSSGQVPVLVNKGWVPSGWIEQPNVVDSVSTSPETSILEKVPRWKFWTRQQNLLDSKGEVLSRTQGTVRVHGVIRGSEEPNFFVPLNVPSTGQWFYIDVPAMARTLGLPENTILIEVLREPNDSNCKETYPIAKDREALLHSSVMPEDHINYALTWYTLSAATTFMAAKRVWGPRK